ncbi:hypothetical protein CBR_g24408 [Chara braunii]|uniref:HslU--HslV peptidase n=1 Tax=Chara braunii TaxID=69332 RepID=A0A388JMN3_CHABU|nr:hypothetical protein CBR_g24408 [Chara braunii]|eukprot:GBG59064.1 hypothetical protein CBR_g24408 [Chara braunii]
MARRLIGLRSHMGGHKLPAICQAAVEHPTGFWEGMPAAQAGPNWCSSMSNNKCSFGGVEFKEAKNISWRHRQRPGGGICHLNSHHQSRGYYQHDGYHAHHHGDPRAMMGTTVLCVRKDGKVVIVADGQVTVGSEIIKPNVRKVRRIGDNVIGGFAGATADAFTLFERLEAKLDEHPGQLTRAAVELAKAWRTDKYLRRLDAVMVVADPDLSLTITGNGDVLEPHDGIIGIGSGGSLALAAARALIDVVDMDAESIARKAMKIAADTCIYTNHNFTIETIDSNLSPRVDRTADSLSFPTKK